VLNSLRKMFASPAPATNHRRWHRIIMSEPVRVSTHGESRAAMLDEICAGGARVKISQRLSPGSVIGIDFTTAAGDHHALSARVVHALKDERGFAWRCGLCFIDAEPAETRRLDDYVEQERKRREVGFAMPRV
jgi:c-di-GMP-binding flagellar brake protein YcgR